MTPRSPTLLYMMAGGFGGGGTGAATTCASPEAATDFGPFSGL
ncbi:MAG TPA: hypothetical protein VFR18_16290 [Terriglobia bacterium]|nr:hypothetical protein [Terriglobia bacterium]